MPRLSTGIGIIVILLLLSGCAERRHWQEAQAKNTVWAYEEFLELHPQGTRADEARKRRHALLISQRHPSFKSVRTARINVRVAARPDIREALAPDVTRIAAACLRYTDVEIAVQGDNQDMLLDIDVDAEPLGGSYGSTLYLYTGASVRGTVRLKTPSGHEVGDDFHYKRGVDLETYSVHADSPARAPFGEALEYAGLERKIWLLIARGFGNDPLVLALKDASDTHAFRYFDSSIIPRAAAQALAQINDTRTVEPLIRALPLPSFWRRNDAEAALIAITGQKFDKTQLTDSQRAERWRKWWKEEGSLRFNR